MGALSKREAINFTQLIVMLYTARRKIVFCFFMMSETSGKNQQFNFLRQISVIVRIFFKCDEKSNQDMAPTYLGFFQET